MTNVVCLIDGKQIIVTFSNADILMERSKRKLDVFINVPNCGENPAIRLS